MISQDELARRAREYAQRRGLLVGNQLGFGVHGRVFATECQPQTDPAILQSAIKIHYRNADYRREREVYLRLRENQVTTVRGCHVPRLLNYDDDLLILEMSIVTRPFILDFAGAFLDQPVDFSDEVLAEWHAEKQEQFGTTKWREVQSILRHLESLGIFMIDVTPNNIALLD
jgi:hypothetical protein